MKKTIVFFIALLLVCAAFGQKTNSFHVVQSGDNAWDLAKEHYGDPYSWREVPNYGVTYREKTGWYYAKLKPGDTIWLGEKNGGIIDQSLSDTVVPNQADESWAPEPLPWWANVSWGWIIFFLLVLALLIGAFTSEKFRDFLNKDPLDFFKKNKKESPLPLNEDPITAGPPQVPGGVNDQQAPERIMEIARGMFPNRIFSIGNIRRGRLSGLAMVHYADDETKILRLNNIVAYAGDVSFGEGEEVQTIYFLQGCGNDARAGEYMDGDQLVFVEDEKITNPAPAPPSTLPHPGATESFNLNTQVLKILEQAVEKGLVDRFKIEKNDEQFLVSVEMRGRKRR